MKYRGLTKEGKWVYGYYVRCRGHDYILPSQNDWELGFDDRFIATGADENRWFQVIPETVGEYTGLKDKDGRENYEGDILGGTDADGDPIDPFIVKDETAEKNYEGGHFLKLDGKRIGRDLESYAFMQQMMGLGALLPHLLAELVLRLKTELRSSYVAGCEYMRFWGLDAYPDHGDLPQAHGLHAQWEECCNMGLGAWRLRYE